MEGEIKNFLVVWITVLASLCYCHTIGKFIPKGTSRLFSILPITSLFFYLPLNLTTFHLVGITSFFVAWMANFKILLFAFGNGPLSSYPPLLLPRFILISCLPIKIQKKDIEENPSQKTTQTGHKLNLGFATKIVLLAIVFQIYSYKDFLHPKIVMVVLCMYVYMTVEILLAVSAAMARATVHLELEPPLDRPYLSSSLQDFWGKRWNLIVSGILRPSVYDPVRAISTRLIGRKWGPIPAILATFFVSALMHELIFYYFGRVKPTWEISCFFLIHGVCLVIEICIKKSLNGKFQLHRMVSGPLVVGFVLVTAIWLFIPPVLRCGIDVKAAQEVKKILLFCNPFRFRY